MTKIVIILLVKTSSFWRVRIDWVYELLHGLQKVANVGSGANFSYRDSNLFLRGICRLYP